jgi:hypothetical protein
MNVREITCLTLLAMVPLAFIGAHFWGPLIYVVPLIGLITFLGGLIEPIIRRRWPSFPK